MSAALLFGYIYLWIILIWAIFRMFKYKDDPEGLEKDNAKTREKVQRLKQENKEWLKSLFRKRKKPSPSTPSPWQDARLLSLEIPHVEEQPPKEKVIFVGGPECSCNEAASSELHADVSSTTAPETGLPSSSYSMTRPLQIQWE